MKSLLELHILQNIAPSSLNQDESSALKDCLFGGVRRSRISSQSWKRAMREYVREHQLLPAGNLAQRSRLFPALLAQRLSARGHDANESAAVVESVLETLGLDLHEGAFRYLVFFSESELGRMVELMHDAWDPLLAASSQRGTRRRAAAVSPELKTLFEASIVDHGQGGNAVDLALFGRILMVRPGKNGQPACQVAHALSTHASTREYDFFTGLDDLLPQEQAREFAISGTLEFNSACYYRYIAIDLATLERNLSHDAELVTSGLDAFLRAAILALPSARQNSFAAHNPPGFVAMRHRTDGAPLNLANAFELPVKAEPGVSLTLASQRRLSSHWRKMDAFLGRAGAAAYWSLEDEDVEVEERVESLDQLLQSVHDWRKV